MQNTPPHLGYRIVLMSLLWSKEDHRFPSIVKL